MAEDKDKESLLAFISPNTTKDEFTKANATDKIVDSLSYLGVFAPNPGTFDRYAFDFCTGDVFQNESESNVAWNFFIRTGIFKDEYGSITDNGQGKPFIVDIKGRMSISKEVAEMAHRFLT